MMDFSAFWIMFSLFMVFNTIFLLLPKKTIEIIIIHLIVMLFTFAIGTTEMFSFFPIVTVFLVVYSMVVFIGSVLMVEA